MLKHIIPFIIKYTVKQKYKHKIYQDLVILMSYIIKVPSGTVVVTLRLKKVVNRDI